MNMYVHTCPIISLGYTSGSESKPHLEALCICILPNYLKKLWIRFYTYRLYVCPFSTLLPGYYYCFSIGQVESILNYVSFLASEDEYFKNSFE